MPSRRRHRNQPPLVPPDPVAQFGALLKESADRDAAEAAGVAQAAADRWAAKLAAEHRAASLVVARRELDRAIATVRRARDDRRGVAEADAAWRAAKARVLELETGAAPTWAPVEADETTAGSADEPADPADGPSDDSVDESIDENIAT